MFTIDGMEWNIPCEITRKAELKASDISGTLMNKEYFNDILGTWLWYEVIMAIPFGRENDYYTIYEALTDPVNEHTFVLPYNGTTVSFTGRVESVNDKLYKRKNGNYWGETSFTVISSEPYKNVSLSEVTP